MSALYTFSPLLRRSGTIPSWTCRACSKSQGQAIAQRSAFARGTTGRQAFATRTAEGRSAANDVAGNGARSAPGPTANATEANARSGGRPATPNAGPKAKNKRRRRIALAGGTLTVIGAAAITINDDARHAYVAAQRSYRVLGTLAANIKEYVIV